MSNIVGLILAGGQGRRMGGIDKPFAKLGHETLLERSIARARPQVGELLINAGGDPARFAHIGLAVLPDSIEGFLGPLAGILTGLEWMRANRPDARWLASFPCDCPFFPKDLVEQLVNRAQAENAAIAFAASGGHIHPVFAVWSAGIDATPQSLLEEGASRKVEDFIALFPSAFVTFPRIPVDPFFNVNTPDDLARSQGLMAEHPSIR